MDMQAIPFIRQKKDLDIRRIFFVLPQGETFGNLGNMYRTMILKNEYLNKLIAEIYTTHYLWRKSFVDEFDTFHYSRPSELEELNYKIETLAYWLRKSCDKLIYLQYLLKYWCVKNQPPPQIKIDSIGKLISTSINDDLKKELLARLQKHLFFLNDINNVSNISQRYYCQL